MTTDETVDQSYKYHYEHLSSQKKGNHSCFLMEQTIYSKMHEMYSCQNLISD